MASAAQHWTSIITVASNQHGVIGERQLTDVGLTAQQRRSLVESGRLEKVAPRVWRIAGSPVTREQRLYKGLLSLGPRSWISHEAAAQQHGFDRTTLDRVEFLVWRTGRDAVLDERVHSTRRWTPSDAVEIGGLRFTSATRTIFDLANAGAHPDRLAAAIDTAVRLELSSPEAIRRRLETIRARGLAGVVAVERLLEHTGGHTMLERKFLELMSLGDLPLPETQVTFRHPDDDHFVARVDFYYRRWNLVVEVTGRVGHSTPEDRARDAQRRNELQELGVGVFEFTWEDVTRRSWAVIGQMRRLLHSNAVLVGEPAASRTF